MSASGSALSNAPSPKRFRDIPSRMSFIKNHLHQRGYQMQPIYTFDSHDQGFIAGPSMYAIEKSIREWNLDMEMAVANDRFHEAFEKVWEERGARLKQELNAEFDAIHAGLAAIGATRLKTIRQQKDVIDQQEALLEKQEAELRKQRSTSEAQGKRFGDDANLEVVVTRLELQISHLLYENQTIRDVYMKDKSKHEAAISRLEEEKAHIKNSMRGSIFKLEDDIRKQHAIINDPASNIREKEAEIENLQHVKRSMAGQVASYQKKFSEQENFIRTMRITSNVQANSLIKSQRLAGLAKDKTIRELQQKLEWANKRVELAEGNLCVVGGNVDDHDQQEMSVCEDEQDGGVWTTVARK